MDAESGPTALLAPVPSGKARAVDIETPDWDVHRLEGTVVQVHADPDIDGLVIIRTDAGLLWPHDQYRRVPPA